MKKLFILFAIAVICCSISQAQYISLPDTNFRNQLRYIHPTCFNAAGQLDTTCSEIVNEDSIGFPSYYYVSGIRDLTGLRYFKNLSYLDLKVYSSNDINLTELPPVLKTLDCSFTTFASITAVLPPTLQTIYSENSNFIGFHPSLPLSLLYLSCRMASTNSLPDLPQALIYLDCSDIFILRDLPVLPASLKYLKCSGQFSLAPLPALPTGLKYLDCSGSGINITTLPAIPASLDTLMCSNLLLTALPVLPNSLKYLACAGTKINSLPSHLPDGLIDLYCGSIDSLNTMPPLPPGLKNLDCGFTNLTELPSLPASLITLHCQRNSLVQLPALPAALVDLDCQVNKITGLPLLPNGLKYLECSANPLHTIPAFPDSLRTLSCNSDSLVSIPAFPARLQSIGCQNNLLTDLPGLPATLQYLNCARNRLTSLPELPNSLTSLSCYSNSIYCIPKLPSYRDVSYEPFYLTIDSAKIKCLPNYPEQGMMLDIVWPMYGMPFLMGGSLPLCNPTNNAYHCESFPVMQGAVFYDNNNNGIKDAGEPVRSNVRVELSGNKYSFSNNNGQYEIGADSIGTYHLTATAPRYFTYVPAAYNYNFTNYDTLVTGNFALQADTIVDELSIRITPINWAARPGFAFPYMISYENTGTTTLSPTVTFDYDETRLTYNSSSVPGVIDNTSSLSINVGSLAPGESGSFTGYFNLKTTAVIGDSLRSNAIMRAGTYEITDINSIGIRGSFDPNDKQATSKLSPSQVASGNYIDYTIRFQNTGTDTAFNIVISDTLSEDLQANSLQMITSSHTCKTTVKDNLVFFEFLNILLPDSNINEPKSHGFVSFRIKPQTTVAANATITNKAAIYFDYNAPVITNTAGTLIKEFTVVPLKLISFSAVPQTDNTTTLYWNTANEINTKQFVIEQSSDGSKFNPISNVMAKGKANNNYSANVAGANSSLAYYRLKIVDNDGNFSYSPILKIDRRKNVAGFSILTNPVKDVIILNTIDRSLHNTQCSIINTQGAVVKNFVIKQGSQIIDIKDLPTGIYYVRTINGSCRIIAQ